MRECQRALHPGLEGLARVESEAGCESQEAQNMVTGLLCAAEVLPALCVTEARMAVLISRLSRRLPLHVVHLVIGRRQVPRSQERIFV